MLRSLEHFTLTTSDSSSQVGSRRHANRLPQLQSEHRSDLSPRAPSWPAAEQPWVSWQASPNCPQGRPHPSTHPTSVATENLTHVVGYFNYSSMSAYARHCLHSICYLPSTSAVPLQGRYENPHIAVRNLTSEMLSSLPKPEFKPRSIKFLSPFPIQS